MTCHLGDDHFFAKLDSLTYAVTVMRKPVHTSLMLRKGRKDTEVAARAKSLPVSADDDHGHFGNISDLPESIEQFGSHFSVNGVVLVRPVQSNVAYRSLDFINDGCVF